MSTPQQSDRPAPPIIGQHVLLDLYEIEDTRLSDADALRALLTEHLDSNGFHRLATNSHQFPGENAGATVIVLLSESHATIHTYPEYGYAAIDVFSCGAADVDGFVAAVIEDLRPGRITRHDELRGG